MKNIKRILAAVLLFALLAASVPFVVSAVNSYWGFNDYQTITQPGAPDEITSYPTTITKVNANKYTMSSNIGGGRTISVSLIKEDWGTFNLGNWILTDGGRTHNFTGDSTDMEYVHVTQTHNGGNTYTGGNHGNEAFVSIDFYNAETGAKLDFSSQTSYTTNGVHVIETTKLLRFNDAYNWAYTQRVGVAGSDSIGDYDGHNITPGNYTDNDVYANVVRKYTFAGPQIKLNVDYKFTRDIKQFRSFNCMLPIDKKYSLYCDMIDKNGAIIKTITSRPYGDTSIANYDGPHNEGNEATRAVVYSKDYPNYQFDIRVNTYKDSVNEHKNAPYKTSYWDMNSTHNKLYFTKYDNGEAYAVTQREGTEYHTECIWLFNYVTQGREPSEGEIPVSRGKTYTNDINTGSLEYNTSYGAKLTDGIASNVFNLGDGADNYGSMIDDSWYLFSMYSTNVKDGVGTTVIDLGTEYELSKVKLHLANVSGMPVSAPSAINVYVSNDNNAFPANPTVTVPVKTDKDLVYWTSAEVAKGVIGRYVKFEFIVPTGLAYVNEIEVYGDIPVEPEDPNLALNRDYIISVTNDPVVALPSIDYSAKLTDGKAYSSYTFNGGNWFMFTPSKNVVGGKGTVTIHFDKICNITKFKMHLINNLGSGVKPPKSIKVYTSVDGIKYTLAGDMPVDQTASVGYWSELKVANIQAGSVRFEIELDGSYATLNEIEIRGTATNTDYKPHECAPKNDVWQSDKNNHWQECSCNGQVNKAKHDKGEWVTVKKAEIGVEGKKELRCTVCGYVIKEEVIPASTFIKGDVNDDGKITARDYLLLKRAYFGTYTLTCDLAAADVNGNGKLDARDYLLLKRAYFGTYTIE